MKIKIYHLYPNAMNLYGDYGNILSIVRRCQWRGIDIEVVKVGIGDNAGFDDADVIFLGGGQDRNQLLVSEDLVARGSAIQNAVESDAVVLAICGGYQLFGQYFTTSKGTEIPGIGVFDAWTIASNTRMIGNILVDCQRTYEQWSGNYRLSTLEKMRAILVGFENHSGITYLGKSSNPLGSIIRGYGNDGMNHWEGCQYRQAFGSYLHGPLLPKNPWFTDYIIAMALRHRYGTDHDLLDLDDTLEIAAHLSAKERAYSSKTAHI